MKTVGKIRIKFKEINRQILINPGADLFICPKSLTRDLQKR
jgi:hypothetical protein